LSGPEILEVRNFLPQHTGIEYGSISILLLNYFPMELCLGAIEVP
jgi:hypothetical protein